MSNDFWKDYEPEPTVTKGYSFADLNPKYAGGYCIGGSMGLQVNLKEKPIWLHRTMMRLCFGWEWKDAK
jgi:hypothetical protein